MIIKRQNPKANPNNALQLTEVDNLCCGDTTSVAVNDYTATLAVTAGTTKVTAIRLGGTTFTFDGSYDPTQKRERDAIVAEIKKAIVSKGYTANEGITVNMVSTNLVVVLKKSALVADWLNTSGTAFVASNAATIGY